MKKGRKKYIILIIILIIYFIVMFISFGMDNFKKKEKTIIIVDNGTVWESDGNKWYNITTINQIKSLNWKEFTVLSDGKKFGNYYLWYDDSRWYLFDKNKKAVSYSGDIFAYQSSTRINVLPMNIKNIEDFTYVRKVLSNNGLSEDSKFTMATVSSFDIDSDGVEEDFYVVSNVFATDFFPDKSFSFVFMVKDNKIYMLYNDIDNNTGTNGCMPYLNNVLDVDNDGNYGVIVSCSKYSLQGTTNMLYTLDDGKFKIIISN